MKDKLFNIKVPKGFIKLMERNFTGFAGRPAGAGYVCYFCEGDTANASGICATCKADRHRGRKDDAMKKCPVCDGMKSGETETFQSRKQFEEKEGPITGWTPYKSHVVFFTKYGEFKMSKKAWKLFTADPLKP